MHHIKRVASGIRTGSDMCAPVFNEIASMTSLTYGEVKEKIRQEVNDYLKNHYNMHRRFTDYSCTYDQYLRDDNTALLTVAYILNGFKDKVGYEKLVNALNNIEEV